MLALSRTAFVGLVASTAWLGAAEAVQADSSPSVYTAGACESAWSKVYDPYAARALCFRDAPLNLPYWGWTHKFCQGSQQMHKLWAGALKCDTDGADEVGKAAIRFDKRGGLTVKVLPGEGWKVVALNVHVGPDYLPTRGQSYSGEPNGFAYGTTERLSVSVDAAQHATYQCVYVAVHVRVCRKPKRTAVPETRVPETKVPRTRVPKTDVPDTKVPRTRVPKTRVPRTDVPDTKVPRTRVPKTDVPDTKVPRTRVPKTDVPDTKVPRTRVPRTDVPDTPAPCVDSPLPISVTIDGLPLPSTPAVEGMDGWVVRGALAQVTRFIDTMKRPGVRAFFPPQNDGVPVGTRISITCPENCDGTPCEAVVVVYHCPPCSDDINGDLPVELPAAQWTPGRCGVLFTLDGETRVYTATPFYKIIPAGTTEELPPTVELLAHTGIFVRKGAVDCSQFFDETSCPTAQCSWSGEQGQCVPAPCGPVVPGRPRGPAVCSPCAPRPSSGGSAAAQSQ